MFPSPANPLPAGRKPGLLRRALRAVAAAAAAVRAVSRRVRRQRPEPVCEPGPLDVHTWVLLGGTALASPASDEHFDKMTAEEQAQIEAFEAVAWQRELQRMDPGRHHQSRRLALRRRLARPIPSRALRPWRLAPLPERCLPPPLASPLLI